MAEKKTLEEAVDEQEPNPPARISPLREFDSLGPDWKGAKSRRGGRMTDEFKRDMAITDAATAADEEDRQAAAKQRQKKKSPLHDHRRSPE